MTTKLILNLVIADGLSLERRQTVRGLLSKVFRDSIDDLIVQKRLEAGEVLMCGEFTSIHETATMKGHRTSRRADGPPLPEGVEPPVRNTKKRYGEKIK